MCAILTTSSLGRLLGRIVPLDARQEIVPRGGVLHVLRADEQLLHHEAVPNLLVEEHTHRPRRHVPDAAGLTVVALERHAVLDGRVALDVDDVADAVDFQVAREVRHTLGLERLRVQLAGARTLTRRFLVPVGSHPD
eukprot:COSAG02_NODE_754_length_17578_cov_97.544825_7_plen_137_part_00